VRPRMFLLLLLPLAALAQIDQQRAADAFNQAKTLCEREGGNLWKVSLCGPIVIADPATKTIATNQPAPEAPRPPALGFANSAMEWGGTRWTAISWPSLVALRDVQSMLLIHEMFHRIQPQLGLLVQDKPSDHLNTPEGRYWMQLEWKALIRAIDSPDPKRSIALSEALAFRAARRSLFPGSAESERGYEINEGLAQYTATVVAAGSRAEALRSAIGQLEKAPSEATFVRQFAYPTGAAYGVLLDEYVPGWTHKIKASDDLGKLLDPFAHPQSPKDLEAAAASYGGPEIRERETRREVEYKARLAELRRRFVDGPVLILPRGRGASFASAGITPIAGEGTVYMTYRTTSDWGTFEASSVLVDMDRGRLIVPAPASVEGKNLKGDGWTLAISDGWVIRPGPRTSDFQLSKEASSSK
jgi:hypothetical protein